MNKLLLLFVPFFIYATSYSQTKMVIDRIQCTSSFSNLFNYLHYPEIGSKVYFAIKNNAVDILHVSFDTNETMPMLDIKTKIFGSIANRPLNTDIPQPKEGLHLFVNINENSTLLPRGKQLDSIQFELMQYSNCVIDVQVIVTDNEGNIKLDRQSDFIIKTKNAYFIGYPNTNYSMSPNSLIGFMQKATKILLDTLNDPTNIQIVNCTPAYFADNFIMPNIAGKQRTITETKKDFATFTLADSSKNLLRFPEMELYLMNLKKKANREYTMQEQAAIVYKKNHGGLKYCNMQHPFRNVLDNKNYTSHIALAIDDEGVYEPIFKFLPGKINFLLAEKDTVARFSIAVDTWPSNKTIFIDRIYNGIDTSTQLALSIIHGEQSIVYSINMEGQMGNHPFNILYSRSIGIKELYYDNQLVCVVKGDKLPESFVLINANLPKKILHQLLMLAFIKPS